MSDRFDDELRGVIRHAVPREAPGRLRDRIEEATEQPASRPSRFTFAWRLAAGMAVAVVAVLAAVSGSGLLTTAPPGTSPSPSAVASASPGSSPSTASSDRWWVWPTGETTCAFPAVFRVDQGHPVSLGNCTGTLLTPAQLMTVPVGAEIDLHMSASSYQLPTSPNNGVLRLSRTADDGATGQYLAVAPGEVTLSTSGSCTDSVSGDQSQGPCPVLEITVVADMPSPPPNASGFTWRPMYVPGLTVDGRMGALVQSGAGHLAITDPFGATWQTGTWPHPTIWQRNGVGEWKRLPDSPVFSGVADRWVDSVSALARNGAGLMAVGAEYLFDSSTANAEAWTSLDGKTWTRAEVDGGTDATMRLVYAVDSGFVAIGTDGYSPHAGFARGTAIWTSPDGKRWTRLASSKIPTGVTVMGVARGTDGFVAVGEVAEPGVSGAQSRLVWFSSDGLHFEPAAPPAGLPADAVLRGVTWTGSAYVAVGHRLSGGAFALRSTDGQVWTLTDLPGGDQSFITGIAPTRLGLLVIGNTTDPSGANVGEYWVSTDGTSWQAEGVGSHGMAGVTLDRFLQAGDLLFVTVDWSGETGDVWSVSAQGP